MIVRLWVLAKLARYLAYLPVIGWRFSDSIQRYVTERLDHDIDIEAGAIDIERAPPTAMSVSFRIVNTLPMAISVSAVNLRIGYAPDGKTLDTVHWSEETAGETLVNIDRESIDPDATGTLTVERYIPHADPPEDTLHVDGTVELQTWFDAPATKRIPLGSVHRDLPACSRALPG
jgi:hypothetical protein